MVSMKSVKYSSLAVVRLLADADWRAAKKHKEQFRISVTSNTKTVKTTIDKSLFFSFVLLLV